MNLARIRELISARTGLQPDSLGTAAVPNAVAERMRLLNAEDETAYAGRLARDPLEFQALIDAIIIPETWFFRGGKIYDALVKLAHERGDTPFRVLSLPCSTGEEPYSIAMAFTDSGLSPPLWSIDAIDLSSTAIAAAGVGRYREFSFRETPSELRARHFATSDGFGELNASIRGRVRFRVGNLLDPSTLVPAGRYDLVLCRNLMIYLTPAARRAALDTLDRLLAPDGTLGVGHAEAGNLSGSQFESVGPEGCFLFRRRTLSAPKSELLPRPAPAPVVSRTVKPMSPSARLAGPPSLSKAEKLADAGRLAEALVECRTLVAVAPSAEAYCLLGIVLGAGGKPESAGDAFRKALYLDPHHRDALTHSLLLAEAQRDIEQAGMFRARLDRLPAQEANP